MDAPSYVVPGVIGRSFLTPSEAVTFICNGMLRRIANPFYVIFLLAAMGGVFLSLGASVYLYVLADPALGHYHISRLLASIFFSSGLVMTVLTGSELLTGSILAVMLAVRGDMPWLGFLRYFSIVAFGNFAGVLLTLAVMHAGGLLNDYSIHHISGVAYRIALYKAHLSFQEAFYLAILCNICVCIGIWGGHLSLSPSGKIFAVILPITLFATVGFEHVVANVFFLSVLFFSQNDLSMMDIFGYMSHNLIPVFFGNMLGGIVVGVVLALCHRSAKAVS